MAVFEQRAHRHIGSKIRATNADIDHVFNAFAVVAFPFTAAHRFREQLDLLAGAGDLRHNVFAVHIYRLIA